MLPRAYSFFYTTHSFYCEFFLHTSMFFFSVIFLVLVHIYTLPDRPNDLNLVGSQYYTALIGLTPESIYTQEF